MCVWTELGWCHQTGRAEHKEIESKQGTRRPGRPLHQGCGDRGTGFQTQVACSKGREGLEGGLGLPLAVSHGDKFCAFPCWPCRSWRRT